MKQGEVQQIKKAKTPYNAQWSVIDGQVVPLQMTDSELKTISARGQKQVALMPPLEPFVGVGAARAPYGFINVMELGAVPDLNPGINEDKWTDSTKRIQEYLDAQPANTKPRLYMPAMGEYGFFGWDSIIVRAGKGLQLIGDEGLPYLYQEGIASKLKVGKYYAPRPGIMFEKGSLTSTVKDLFLIGEGGTDNPVAGIYSETIVDLQRVYAERFTQGFWFQGSDARQGSNTSMSVVTDCRAAHNAGDGFVAVGYDGNRIRFTGIISVDNKGYGWRDKSFLGCTWLCHQTENNKLGGWSIDTDTGQVIVAFQYDEGGQPKNFISPGNGVSIVLEGQNPNGYVGSRIGEPVRKNGGKVFRGALTNKDLTEQLEAQKANIAGMDMVASQKYGEGMKLDFKSGKAHFMSFAKAGVPAEQITQEVNNLPVGRRSFARDITIINGAYMLNGFLHVPSQAPDVEDQVFKLGDFIDNTVFKIGMPQYWRCITPGRIGASQKKFQSTVPFGNYEGDQARQYALLPDEDYGAFLPGDLLRFENGALGQLITASDKKQIEFEHPLGIEIHPGDRIDWMGLVGDENARQPVGYTEDTMILDYEPVQAEYEVGDTEIINSGKAKVLDVWEEFGVKYVRFGMSDNPEARPDWYNEGNNIGFGDPKVDRHPFAYDHTDPKNPTIIMAFPLAHIQAGAMVQVDNKPVKVRRVILPGVTVKPLEGQIYDQTSFVIQPADFQPFI